jgi:ATP-dependent exoDNAse (exonuclease V) alpha subunit
MLNNEEFYLRDFDNDTVKFENIKNLTDKAGNLDIDKYQKFCKANNIETTNDVKHLSYYKTDTRKFNTISINNAIQQLYCKENRILINNPFRYKVDNPIYVGDKIVRIENEYVDGVCHANGEEAEVVDYDKLTDTVTIKYEGNRYNNKLTPEELYDEFRLSYALTIHKSQGSQYETVVLYLEDDGIIDRSALYTAISRAVKRLIIVSTPRILTNIQRNKPVERLSLFMERFNDCKIE